MQSDLSEHARHDIDVTLRRAARTLDQRLAVYRVAIFSSAAVFALAMQLVFFRARPFWGPPRYFGICAVVAIAMWALAERAERSHWIHRLAGFADLTAIGLAPLGFQALAPLPAEAADRPLLVSMMVVAPVLLLIAQVHSLREEPRWALAFHVYAGALFVLLFLALTSLARLAPYVAMCVAVFVLSGFIARHAATATRERLREFAHLNLLKRFLPATAVERVMTESGTLPTLESREVLLTVVSTDLRGFTSLIERLEPSQAIAQLNEYHSAMVDVIARHGGIVDKFIGDGALVVFGLGREGEETSCGATAAIACALEMRERLDVLNRDRSADGREPLRMGIGIHTGRVVCGCLGSGARIELTIIGDTVNTAARLEALTKQTDTVIVLSEETRRQAETRAPFVDLGLRTLPGKSDPVRVYGLG